MKKAPTNGIPVHRHPAVWFSRIKTKWPILVWLSAVAFAWWLYQQRGPPTAFVGVVHVQHEAASPLARGRVLEVLVQLGDRVEAGQVMARIQPEPLATDPTISFDVIRIDRQFLQFVQDAENALWEAEIARARDEAELGALTAELERLEALRESGLVDDEVIARVRVPKIALEKAVELFPEYIARLSDQLDVAREQYGATRDQMANTGIQLPGVTNLFELRSLQSGTVSDIPTAPGSVVQPGDPVVRLLTDAAQSVVGYVHEAQDLALSAGLTVYLQAASSSGEWISGTVVAVSPDISPLPVEFQRMPSAIVRGRRVIIQPGEDFVADPGERVNIALKPGTTLF